jgi:hypothetical protein
MENVISATAVNAGLSSSRGGCPAELRAKPPQVSEPRNFNHCFGVEPFVERLLSGFLLSDAPRHVF